MTIAVIPACEGSVKLPNKNMRVINGRPLIYYTIQAAIGTKLIDRVIVSSNSEEILLLAKLMGAETVARREELCCEEISIDEVVYDALRGIRLAEDDLVVAIQSVSPTVSSDTIDNAIKKCMADCTDTVISVARMQRFFWYLEDGKPVPFYGKRSNRHMLEPVFVERGGFLVTRAECVTPLSLLGERVELMEMDDDEAVNIDGFGDLKQAESIIKRRRIAFYVNGDNVIGLGHIYRVLQIADELSSKPDIYYDRRRTDAEAFGNTKHNILGVDGTDGLMEQLSTKEYDLLINDVLSTSEDYMLAIKKAAPHIKILNFEDEGEGVKYADCVINALYEEIGAENVYVGSKYFVVSKLFLLYKPIEIKPRVKNVLVTFGGADPNSYTEALLDIALEPRFSDIHFTVVLGKAKKNADGFVSFARFPNIEILRDISDMPRVMSTCDAAVASRGRTGFELAVLGIPSVSIAQNEREARHDFISEKNGFLCLPVKPSLKDIEQALLKLIGLSEAERREMQRKMLVNDLRSGRKNVLELIEKIIV